MRRCRGGCGRKDSLLRGGTAGGGPPAAGRSPPLGAAGGDGCAEVGWELGPLVSAGGCGPSAAGKPAFDVTVRLAALVALGIAPIRCSNSSGGSSGGGGRIGVSSGATASTAPGGSAACSA